MDSKYNAQYDVLKSTRSYERDRGCKVVGTENFQLKSTRSYERDRTAPRATEPKRSLNPPALTSGILRACGIRWGHPRLNPPALTSGIQFGPDGTRDGRCLNPPALTSGISVQPGTYRVTGGLNPPALTSGIRRDLDLPQNREA